MDEPGSDETVSDYEDWLNKQNAPYVSLDLAGKQIMSTLGYRDPQAFLGNGLTDVVSWTHADLKRSRFKNSKLRKLMRDIKGRK